jgi:lysophospholipase L1-like esterase
LAAMLLVLLFPRVPAGAADVPAFELKEGDRVALVGNTFFEREQTYSYLETLLATRFADRNIAFRNLGWSGDTVFGTARAYFEGPDQGFERLKRHVTEVKPTVLFICYGMGESFDGPAGLEGFVKGYNRLLDMLKEQSAPEARVVLISPIRHEALGDPYPDPTQHNEALRLYTDAIAKIAKERGARFIDLFDPLVPADTSNEKAQRRFTENGIHLTPAGYFKAALEIERQLGYGPREWRVAVDTGTGVVEAVNAKVEKLQSDHAPTFKIVPELLPVPAGVGSGDEPSRIGVLKVTGLSAGERALRSTKTVVKASAERWAKGVEITSADDPTVQRVEKLRKLLVGKNVQYFNKYRPANETYIFLFRKGEQGRNAVEIPQFDAPIAQLEAEVAKLRKPEPVTYTLVKE